MTKTIEALPGKWRQEVEGAYMTQDLVIDARTETQVWMANKCAGELEAALAALSQGEGEAPVELAGIAEVVAEGYGFWASCTGCHELNEGHATGPWSSALNCNLGLGCRECGGIGAVWDSTDYTAFAAELEAHHPEAQQPEAVAMYQIRSHYGEHARWKECDKATFDQYMRYHQRFGGEPPVRALYTTPPKPAEADYTEIANRAQAITGRSIFPSTVKAILDCAHPTTPTHDGGEDAAIAAAFREVAKCSYAQDGVAGELFAKVRKLAALTPATPQGVKDR